MKIRRIQEGFLHWCPGCDEAHIVEVPRWTWNNDTERPTVMPSVNMPGRCHYVLTNGVINFCADCSHALKGKSAELPDFPTDW